MRQITLLHTSPPYSSGTVVRTTHAGFRLHDTVEVAWPLNPITNGMINVVLMHEKARYLANWITNGSDVAYQFTYEVIMQLPSSRRSSS